MSQEAPGKGRGSGWRGGVIGRSKEGGGGLLLAVITSYVIVPACVPHRWRWDWPLCQELGGSYAGSLYPLPAPLATQSQAGFVFTPWHISIPRPPTPPKPTQHTSESTHTG